jgi:hypothetical protein
MTHYFLQINYDYIESYDEFYTYYYIVPKEKISEIKKDINVIQNNYHENFQAYIKPFLERMEQYKVDYSTRPYRFLLFCLKGSNRDNVESDSD